MNSTILAALLSLMVICSCPLAPPGPSGPGDVPSGAVLPGDAGPAADALRGGHHRQHPGGTHPGAFPHAGQSPGRQARASFFIISGFA